MKKILTNIIALAFISVCMTFSAKASGFRDAHGMDNKVVYSIYLRNYANLNAAATFTDLRKDIPRLKELGVDVIHLLPFYEMGIEHAKGSPYCIRNYREVDSRYGSKEDLRQLIDELHANGMKIWFDWVGNHTAYDHPWVKQHPDWYTERQDFDDVRSVNSSNPELRNAMAEDMRYWVEEFGIDGYRCDFAHAPGKEFWLDIVNKVDPEHKLYWLAEGNEYGITNDWMRSLGSPFDSRYGWSYAEFMYEDKYDRKDQTVKGDLGKGMFHLSYPQDRATFLTYLGSHDIFQGMEPQVSANTQDVIYGDNLIPFTVMTMLAPGVPMIYMGQEINYSKSGGVSILVDTEAVDWNKIDNEYLNLVKQLISLRHNEPALATLGGQLINHVADSDSVYVFERRIGDNSIVAMVNFSYNPQNFDITSKTIPGNMYKDAFNGEKSVLKGKSLILPAKGYAVYVKEDGELQSEDYEIIVSLPMNRDTSTPVLTVTAQDPLNVGGELVVAESIIMSPIDGQKNKYRVGVPYLPEFGYDIHILDIHGNEMVTIHSDVQKDHYIELQ